jgi:hypothetical protein
MIQGVAGDVLLSMWLFKFQNLRRFAVSDDLQLPHWIITLNGAIFSAPSRNPSRGDFKGTLLQPQLVLIRNFALYKNYE